MTSMTTKSTKVDDINILYDSYGSGDHALVFIHGWACSRKQWKAQRPLFDKYRSVVIDLPGHGDSDAPVDVDYSAEFFADAVASLLRYEAITKVVMVGHSMGGPISTMMMRLHTELVAGIIYVDSFLQPPPSCQPLSQRKASVAYMSDDEALKSLFAPMIASADLREQILAEMVAAPKHMRISSGATSTQFHSFRYDEVYNVPAVLMQTPCLKPHDPRWHYHVPQLQIEDWPDNGHWPQIEDPARFNASVDGFIGKHGLLR